MSSLGAIITIILVVGWVVKGLSSAMGNDEKGQKKRPSRSLEEWDELQAQRRAQMSDQQQALSEMQSQSSTPDPSQMTMAERIELARQRARQQAGLQADTETEQRQQALARQQAQQQRQAAEQRARQQQAEKQRAAHQRAQRERAQQKRVRQQRQAAEEQQQREQRRRSKQRPAKPRATTGSKREGIVADSIQRVHKGHEHTGPAVVKRTSKSRSAKASNLVGTLDRNALRKAFIMKELLDKPVALRDPQAELPS